MSDFHGDRGGEINNRAFAAIAGVGYRGEGRSGPREILNEFRKHVRHRNVMFDTSSRRQCAYSTYRPARNLD